MTNTTHALARSMRLHRGVETIDFLPVVKAYPVMSKTYGEVSCIAGIEMGRTGPRWIRLYPVPFRALDDAKQFAKYQPMRLQVETHSGDKRRETRRPNRDSIELVGEAIPATNAWAARRRFVEPLMADSMCALIRSQASDGTSLGVFRPGRVIDLLIEPADRKEAKQQMARAWAAQGSLLDGLGRNERDEQIKALELLPWTFKYRYECNDSSCNTHTQSIIDWEIAALFHRVRHHSDWQERIKQKWLGELCSSDRDTAFFVGNQHQYPQSFLVLGVWWPRRAEQLALADVGDV